MLGHRQGRLMAVVLDRPNGFFTSSQVVRPAPFNAVLTQLVLLHLTRFNAMLELRAMDQDSV